MARSLTGLVSSDKSNKTIVVSVRTQKSHPLYKKQYSTTRKFMAHDGKNEAHIGDKVQITESRPLSAKKRWTLLEIVDKARIKHVEPKLKEEEKDGDK